MYGYVFLWYSLILSFSSSEKFLYRLFFFFTFLYCFWCMASLLPASHQNLFIKDLYLLTQNYLTYQLFNYQPINCILIMIKLNFLWEKKVSARLKKKNNISINVFCYENKLTFSTYVSNQKFENSMHLLLVINENKSQYVYIKDFNRFMFHKTKNKSKKDSCKSCLQCFRRKNVLTKQKEVCFSINGAQSIRLENWTIEFKNYFKQIPVPFKFYAHFECILKNVESDKASYSRKISRSYSL